ncbi:hypothetical protein A5672_09380 [Mycobacterium alsense]|uniref:DUF385 domain-containing protein n=1 Tax=Mycobacterium alsense TaxID=324058 RepID=A0ABD6P757_9MYCO|nr:hypothetical protein [Mycobacterium alsense]OBG45168.1 hypothetical protein A5672_09380 [Mycobacterium alsense]OBI96000.1 hypothetical protein A5660_08870 [Mycobacterium alsense]
MAEHAIDAGHPPSALLRLVNPVLGFLLRTPLAGPARKQLMVLSFIGRKSGKSYSIPVSAHVIDHELYALTGAAWKQNFRDGAPARVVYDGKATDMHGELIRDRAAVSDLFHRCAESYGVQRAQRMIGLKFRDPRIPSREEFAEAVDRLHLAAVRLTPDQ